MRRNGVAPAPGDPHPPWSEVLDGPCSSTDDRTVLPLVPAMSRFRTTSEATSLMSNTRNRAPRVADPGSTTEPHKHLGDERLIDAIARHDQTAFAEAYRQHGSRVNALARGLCGDARAEDLTQEIFLQLWNNPQRFDADRGSLRSYLLMQAHGRAVDMLRSDNARTARESVQDVRRNAEGPGAEADALLLLERAEIDELVAALPGNERHPIVLAYFGGHTYREVARLLAVPEGTVKSRIRSGLKRLRMEGALQLDVT